MARRRVVLVTGFPTSFLATRVARKVLESSPLADLRFVVQPKHLDRAKELIAAMPQEQRDRVRLLEGDAAAMDLGLSGRELLDLANEVDVIHHCASVTWPGVDAGVAEQGNVGSAREVLELAEAADHLERLVYWSTTAVAGARRGYVLEEELAAPAGFRTVIEETRFRAERIVREAAKNVPVTILRPATIVGDSVTGEIDRFEGPYLLVLLMLNSPADLRMPMPGRGEVPLHVVPIDWVVDAGLHIVADPRSLGRTYHLVDPSPLSARRVFELIARAAGRPVPRGFVPTNIATAVLKTPGLERFAHMPRAFLEQLQTEVVYDDRNTREILAGSGLECPSLDSYVDVMVDYVRKQQAQRRARSAESTWDDYDPLA